MRKIQRSSLDYISQATLITIAAECTFWIADHYHWWPDADYLLPPAVAFGYVALSRLWQRNHKPSFAVSPGVMQHGVPMARPKKTIFQNLVAWGGGKLHEPPETTGQTRIIKWKEQRPREFYWDVQLTNRLMPVKVFEWQVYDFCKAARRRQMSNDPQIYRHALSRTYFTKQHRPYRFRGPVYEATVKLLASCGMIQDRWQGASGYLAFHSPAFIIEVLKTLYPLP